MQPLARIELNRRDRLGFAVSVPRKDAALIVVARLQFAAVATSFVRLSPLTTLRAPDGRVLSNQHDLRLGAN